MVLACMLMSCVLPRSTESPVHTFVLAIDESAREASVPAARPQAHGVLIVGLPQAEAGFEQPRMAYLKRPYEVHYYANSQWADAPPRMLAPLLVRSLDTSGLWRAVVPMPTAVQGEYRLDTSGLVVQQEFIQQPSRTRVQLRAQLIEMKEQRLMGARSFEAFEPALSEDAYGGVLAANCAVTKVLQAVNDWIASCLRGGMDPC